MSTGSVSSVLRGFSFQILMDLSASHVTKRLQCCARTVESQSTTEVVRDNRGEQDSNYTFQTDRTPLRRCHTLRPKSLQRGEAK